MKKIVAVLMMFGAVLMAGAAPAAGELLTGKWFVGKGISATVEKSGVVKFARTEGQGSWIATTRFKPETGATYRLEMKLTDVPEGARVEVIVRYNKEGGKERMNFKPAQDADGVLAVDETFTVSANCKFAEVSVWCSRSAEGDLLELGKCSVKKVEKK